jgi:glycosyltransferase involved in cell wall biosynthesis
VEKLGLALADAVVANSRAGLVAYGLAEDERSSVVYNGFDLSRLDTLEAAHRATGARDSVSVVMVARMHPAKDWRLLVQVAREISLGTTGWRFIAVGSGPERGEIYAGATDLIDAGVIEFREPGLEVLPVVASADIGVLLSNSPDFAEGCSNSILEYMACGLPVVCTASGGNPELVEHGATGLLIPPHSGEALVSALRQLTDDSMALHEMGKEGRRRVTAQFTVRTMVRSYVSLYETLMVRRGAQPA